MKGIEQYEEQYFKGSLAGYLGANRIQRMGNPRINGIKDLWNYIFMDQDTRWITRYNEVKEFIEREHRYPSKYRLEEHDMLNWLKATRKKLNSGELKQERAAKFKELMELMDNYKRVNQYK